MTNYQNFDDDFEDPITSPLQSSYEKDGQEFLIKIYRSPYETLWTLEICNNSGHSNVLGVSFNSDWHAFEEATKILDEKSEELFNS